MQQRYTPNDYVETVTETFAKIKGGQFQSLVAACDSNCFNLFTKHMRRVITNIGLNFDVRAKR